MEWVKDRTNIESTHGKVSTIGPGLSSMSPEKKVGLPPVPDFPGCPGFPPCCPTSRQDQPRDAKCPGFQGAVKMTIIIK